MAIVLHLILLAMCIAHISALHVEEEKSPVYVEGQMDSILIIMSILIAANILFLGISFITTYSTPVPPVMLAGFLLLVVGKRADDNKACNIADTFNIILSLSTIITSIWL